MGLFDFKRIFFVAAILLLVVAFFALDLTQYLDLEFLQSQRQALVAYYQSAPLTARMLYFLAYVLVMALSLPVIGIMTLVGGAIFGLWWGTLLASFASTIGATLAFLISRYLLRDIVQLWLGNYLSTVNKGVEEDGASYLFSLRIVSVIPPSMINITMGLTPIRTSLFYAVSQIGMLPAHIVYVNAGSQLGQLDTLSDILSPGLVAGFILLAVFPWLAKQLLITIKSKSTG